MDLILYTSNAVLPVFLVIFVGIGLNKLGFFSETTKNELVKLVFYVGTPCLLFSNISGSDLSKTMNPHFLGFTVLAIPAFLLLCILLTFFIKDSKKKGAVIQIGYRSNFAIAGMPIAVNLMDEAGVALTAVTLSFVVIVFNVSAVALLSYYGDGKKSPKAVLSGIIKNPLILGTLAGLFFAVFHIPVPIMLEKTIGILGDIASCIGLIVIGAEISLRGFQRDKAYILFSVFLRNILSPIFYLTIGTLMGFRGNPLLVLAVLSSVPAAVNCFAMAKQMGVDAQITAFGVSITSLLSVVSIFISVYVIKLLGLA